MRGINTVGKQSERGVFGAGQKKWKIFSRLLGARTAGDTFTHATHGKIEFTVTTLPSAGVGLIYFRFTDANNCWYLYWGSTGAVSLAQVASGVDTPRGNSAAGAIANGKKILILIDGNLINVYVNGVLKVTYASATWNNTVVGGKLNALGTGGAVSDIVLYRKSGFPL